MKRSEIRDQAREWLADTVAHNDGDFLYSTRMLNRFINEAQREVALRSRLAVDSTTAALCTIAVTANTAIYPLDPLIIVARRIEYESSVGVNNRWALRRTTFDVLDLRDPRWRQNTSQSPTLVVQDLDVRVLHIVPTPTADATLHLVVWRYPTDDESIDADSLEPAAWMPEHFHVYLAHWACHRVMMTKDAETGDIGAAIDHLGMFEATFGKRPTAKELRALACDPAGESQSYFM